MLEKDKNFRAHSRPITYSNFFKELFMMDDLEVKIDKYLDIIKGKY